MISEDFSYCSECYQKLQEKKNKKKRFKRKEKILENKYVEEDNPKLP